MELGERSVRNFLTHRMTTYAAALAYRGLFGLFPFVLLVVVLLGLLQVDGFFQRMLEMRLSFEAPTSCAKCFSAIEKTSTLTLGRISQWTSPVVGRTKA